MNDQKLFVDIIQKRAAESFLILDFEIIDNQFKPNVIIHEEISGDDNKLVKYLIKNFHKQKLQKPHLQHIYQIIALLYKKHKKYYNWLQEIQLPKLNKFVQIEHKELYVFVPKIDEICNRVTEQYLQQDILYITFIGRLKELLSLIKDKDSDKEIENKLNKIIKSIFKESNRLLDTESLTSNNPCLCLNKKSHKEFLCYLKEDIEGDKSTFKINCTNFRTNSFYTKVWDKVETIIYDQQNLESQKIHFISVDQFYTELFINSLLKELWMPEMLVKQLTAYTCKDKGHIVYQSISGGSNLKSFFRKKENKHNYKLFNSILLQLYGSLLTLQDPESGMMLLHKHLTSSSIHIAKSDQDKNVVVFEEIDIDEDVLEAVISTFENRELQNLEGDFQEWLKETYGFEMGDTEDANNSNDIEDNDDDDDDDDDDDEDDDDTEDIENNDQAGGRDDDENDDEDDDENDDEDDDEDNDEDDVEDNDYEIYLINKIQIMFSNFNKASISTLIPTNDGNRTLMRLHSVTSDNKNSDITKIEQIDYNKYIDVGSTYTLDDYTPNDSLFYLSFDTYYSLISFLLDEANSRMFFKNKYYRWIWASLWKSEEDANKISKLFFSQKSKSKVLEVLEVLQGVTLLNSSTYILFLKMFYLQDSKLL